MKHAEKKTRAEIWHEQAERNWKREFAAVLIVLVVIFSGLGIGGTMYNNYVVEQAEKAQQEAQAAREAKRAEDLRIFRDTQEHEAQKRYAAGVYSEILNLKELDAAEEYIEEDIWYEEEETYYYEYSEPYWYDYDTSDGISAEEFQFLGVVEQDGVTYTWYSQNVLPGGGLDELNANGRHVEGGFVMDGDGYIAVASSDYEKGTVVDTPFGPGKVYDSGCDSGKIDVYTNF